MALRRITRLPPGGSALWSDPVVGPMLEAEFFGTLLVDITGASAAVASSVSAGQVAQTHLLTAGASVVAASSAVGLVSQTHVLTGNSTTVGSGAGVGSIIQTHLVSGLPVVQPAQSTSGALSQVSLLSGSPSSVATLAPSGSIAQTNLIAGSAAACQPLSADGAVSSTAVLSAASLIGQIESTAGAVGQIHVLSGGPTGQIPLAGVGQLQPGAGLTFPARLSKGQSGPSARPSAETTDRRTDQERLVRTPHEAMSRPVLSASVRTTSRNTTRATR